MGTCYEFGKGVSKNYEEAVKWYTKAAELGHDFARTSLGECYIYGRGVQKNVDKGVELVETAAKNKQKKAQRLMGDFYENGIGVEKNAEKAMEWYKKAAENENSMAHCIIADKFYEVAQKGGGGRLALALGLGAIIPFTNLITLPAAAFASIVGDVVKMRNFMKTPAGKEMYAHYEAAANLGNEHGKKRRDELKSYL